MPSFKLPFYKAAIFLNTCIIKADKMKKIPTVGFKPGNALQTFTRKICNIADLLPRGKVCNVADLPFFISDLPPFCKVPDSLFLMY